MVFLESNNHPNSLSDINTNIRALKKIGFSVVSTYFTGTTAARYADILLPQIATAYEGRNCFCASQSTDLFKTDKILRQSRFMVQLPILLFSRLLLSEPFPPDGSSPLLLDIQKADDEISLLHHRYFGEPGEHTAQAFPCLSGRADLSIPSPLQLQALLVWHTLIPDRSVDGNHCPAVVGV
jgi:hypothetical protein